MAATQSKFGSTSPEALATGEPVLDEVDSARATTGRTKAQHSNLAYQTNLARSISVPRPNRQRSMTLFNSNPGLERRIWR